MQFISPPRLDGSNKYLRHGKEITHNILVAEFAPSSDGKRPRYAGSPASRRSRSAVMAIASELDQWMASCSTREAMAMLNNHPQSNGEQEPGTLHLLVIEDSPGPEQQWEFLGKKLASRCIVESVRDLQSALADPGRNGTRPPAGGRSGDSRPGFLQRAWPSDLSPLSGKLTRRTRRSDSPRGSLAATRNGGLIRSV